ncbi:thioredoxin and glutathione reductase [Oesophagostomum dentatum]|uniref:Thioredoxin and glutathione reductase n=1 Tax=Oesophagostomum dentatum TaxID=61180 RepID=A0A0B1TKM4_OESDE|nr:thioredoxin and glutathione reductase [Oesophagostomum dentatum]
MLNTLLTASEKQTCKALFRCLLFAFRRFILASSIVDYDLIVLGGGSGGLSCSKAARDCGARVALVDAVAPSPHGTTWGIGGTCANVGCIPKKLIHHAGIVGKEVRLSIEGETLVNVVNDRVKANSWIYRVQLNEKGVKLYTAFASFIDNTTVKTVSADKKRTETLLRAPYIVIATGLRPRYPAIPGAEHGITTDDLFWSKKSPEKTLVVGANYVALESAGMLADLGHPVDLLIRSRPLKNISTYVRCYVNTRCTTGITTDDLFWSKKSPEKTLVVGANYVALESAGMLADLGHPVDLLIRSRPLKKFDQDCVKFVMEALKQHGVNIIYGKEVGKVEQDGDKKKVTFTEVSNRESVSGDVYDTILWAMGRDPQHSSLNLSAAGVRADPSTNRIVVGKDDRTSAINIFAIGDVALGRPELTPTAIRSGYLLAQRLFNGGKELMDYTHVPTTLFTPLELGTVGHTEEEASELFGAGNVEVYHSHFAPFEYVIPQDQDTALCYAKHLNLSQKCRFLKANLKTLLLHIGIVWGY